MITREFKFKNGDEVREKVSGFKGVITGTCFYLTGCNQYLISAESKENKEPVALWYDEGRIELVENEKIKEKDVEADENGCDLPPLVGKRGC